MSLTEAEAADAPVIGAPRKPRWRAAGRSRLAARRRRAGILLSLPAVAVVVALLGVPIAWASFYIKARREELFLSQEFGPSFAEHQQSTGMFLPRFS